MVPAAGIPSARVSCRLAEVAGPPLEAIEVNPFQEHEQVRGFDRDAGRLGLARDGEPEGPLLQSLVEDQVAVGVPVEDLDPVTTSIAEDEQMAAERILREDALD